MVYDYDSDSSEVDERKRKEGIIRKALKEHIYQFPIDRIARVLSPSWLKDWEEDHGKDVGPDHYYYLVEVPAYQDAVDLTYVMCCEDLRLDWGDSMATPSSLWPLEGPAEACRGPISNLLNTCVEIGHEVLDKLGWPLPVRPERFYTDLSFMPYGRWTGDQTYPTSDVQPDIIGGRNVAKYPSAVGWWGRFMGERKKGEKRVHIEIACAINETWIDVIAQSIPYAIAQFMAQPYRTYVLMICFNYAEGTMRYLIFHRSGLTASEDINLRTVQGRKDFLRILLIILLWTHRRHAGFPEYFDGKNVYLKEGEGVSRWSIDKFLYDTSNKIRGRGTCVYRLKKEEDDVDDYETSESEEEMSSDEEEPSPLPTKELDLKKLDLSDQPASDDDDEQSDTGNSSNDTVSTAPEIPRRKPGKLYMNLLFFNYFLLLFFLVYSSLHHYAYISREEESY